MFAAIVEHGPVESAVTGTPGEDSRESLAALAADWSPRVELHGESQVVLDVGGFTRLFGAPHDLARRLADEASARRLDVRIALAATHVAARALALARPGVAVVPRGREAAALAPLPVELLPQLDEAGAGVARAAREQARAARAHLDTLHRWGVTTLGALAALPAAALHARLGDAGPRWQRLARGLDPRPLVVVPPEVRFEEQITLEWPIEGLEPMAFVLARLLDPLCTRLASHDRGALGVRLLLRLVTRDVDRRRLEWPAPIGDARALRTLLLLDLEARPPKAGIDAIHLHVEPGPARTVQETLFTRPLPTPDHVSTLVARLSALMGAGRVGTPVRSDTHRAEAFEVARFQPAHDARARRVSGGLVSRPTSRDEVRDAAPAGVERHPPGAVLRRFRRPVAARVRLQDGRPAHLATRHAGVTGGAVRQWAGPYRTSGEWWRLAVNAGGARTTAPWDRDDWDVAVADGAVYRLSQDRLTGQWTVDGTWD